ncbi:MAG: hypothetical protein ABF649_22245 [Bacillus sp. (in: firmicutes)]
MKYLQKELTLDLKTKIEQKETIMKELIEKVLKEYKPIFAEKRLVLDAAFDKNGEEYFQPGYLSSLTIGVIDERGELCDLHRIKIWECERIFLGVPIVSKFPGSKVIGELLDETGEEIEQELKEYMDEYLE